MRIVIFFDLPTLTTKDRKEYISFRKFLIGEGFIMMQQSVYTKIALNSTAVNLMKTKVNKEKPKHGLVQMLVITEKQFSSMEYIVGEDDNKVVETTQRLVIL